MGGMLPSTGMWQGEVFAISDCLVEEVFPCMFDANNQCHTHYTVGGKCIHHQHIMDAASTLREFDARFLYGNCELFIDSCVIGQMLVVYWRGT